MRTRLRYTYTYAILDISETSYDDIKERLVKAGVIDDYLQPKDGLGVNEDSDLLVFNTVAFRAEKIDNEDFLKWVMLTQDEEWKIVAQDCFASPSVSAQSIASLKREFEDDYRKQKK